VPVTVVAGGQYGSEGKGKVALHFAAATRARAVVRVGGPNSGHTACDEDGRLWTFRHLPTAALLDDVICVLPAGSYIDSEVLLREVASVQLPPDRLAIDPKATLVTATDAHAESRSDLGGRIGSTETGTGAALTHRIARNGTDLFAAMDNRLSDYLTETTPLLRSLLSDDGRVLIEGTQGFGLSILHSPHYPFVTARDTTAAAFVGESGLSPVDVDQVVLTLRAFPIRVAGNSGPLPRETSWEEVGRISRAVEKIVEYTSVTKRVRRVAEFDPDIVLRAIAANAPTHIVLNHVDYVDYRCREESLLTDRSYSFVSEVSEAIRAPIHLAGTGARTLVEMQFERSRREVA
jgi:adenylosuccinate synthase